MTVNTASARPELPYPPYDPLAVERKWQARWIERGTNHVDVRAAKRPYYQLMMFPYPSAEGLHVGNLYAFTGNDIHGRWHRMQGFDVLEPFGYDAFGIHSENFALKQGIHPGTLIPRNIANFRRQVDRAGLMIDWRYQVDTTDPAYYKWTQWVFTTLFKRGLVYRKGGAVNWCPNDKTVLANEQVEGGKCERCGAVVEQRVMEQWYFRISQYSEQLLRDLDEIDWSDSTKLAQRNWIGKSEGARITFRVLDPLGAAGMAAVSVTGEMSSSEFAIPVFTTRPDTIYGATFLVVAPEHPMLVAITTDEERASVREYQERAKKQDLVTRKTSKEKTGAFTGAYAVNPATGKPIPVWTADYVLMEYGTGAIMAVPGHDQRDFDFATQYGLPIDRVVAAPGDSARTPLAAAYEDNENGTLVNSEQFSGLSVANAKQRIVEALAPKHAEAIANYRLHDWCVSRQRYWGPPIPMVHCAKCGPQPVPDDRLPVLLPHIDDFKPDDSGVSPLARHKDWYETTCPQCGGDARRETDVSDTFLDSAWYFLRYPSVPDDTAPFDTSITKKWLPVDSYIGGNEHAVLHLLYCRFVTRVLHEAGLVPFWSPFKRFRAHGLIIREGAKMSKSKGNVVNPDEYFDTTGADAFRTYLMFIGPFEEGGDFRDSGISGVRRFLDRLWASVHVATNTGEPDRDVMRKLHQTIKKVSEDVPRLSYNTAIAMMMEYINVLRRGERAPHRAEVEPLVQLVAPFAPHVAEELWETLGHTKSIFDSGWPAYDARLVAAETIELVVQINGKTRGTVSVAPDVSQDAAFEAARASATVGRFITGAPKKLILVKGRLLNVVL
jgi:leucyl-tRNA synthetase